MATITYSSENCFNRSWKYNSVCKIVITKAWGPKFGSLAPMSKARLGAYADNHNTGEAETA